MSADYPGSMKRALGHLALVITLACCPLFTLAEGESRHLLARATSAAPPLQLDAADRQWLQERGELLLGSSRPDYPPFEINVSLNDYEGLSADYAGLIAEQLGVSVRVTRYASRHEAIAALREGKIDLLGSSNEFEAADAKLGLSLPYADDLPVIVTRHDAPMMHDKDLAGLRLAMVDHYLPAQKVRQLYPKAQLSLYRSTLAGLAAVELGEADAYLGDAISTDYLIGKSYQGLVKIDHFPQVPPGTFAFAFANENLRLRRLVDSAMARITESERLNILHRWSSGNTSLLLERRISALTEEELAWIAGHPTVSVLVDTALAPLTFNDAGQKVNGITVDLLKQISLRTGLQFQFHERSTVQQMVEEVATGKAQMIGALGYGAERATQLRYTRPYLVSPRVLVTRNSSPAKPPANNLDSRRIALLHGSHLRSEVMQRFPKAKLVMVDNSLSLMEAVAKGDADVAYSSNINASYYISHVFKDQLRIAGVVSDEPAVAAFAVAPDQPQLQAILDKALLSIPPEELDQLINRWRTGTLVSDSPWRNYRTLALQVLVLSALLLAGVVFWNSYLRKLINQRTEAQRALQTQLAFSSGLLEQLRQAKDAAEQASRTKSAFVATMSHEIRTPMNAVIGLLELALEDNRSGHCDPQILKTAHDSAVGLLALIGDILDISRIETGHMTLQPVATDLADLVRSTVRVFEGNARMKGLHLQGELPAAPLWVLADPLRIKQILSNLLSNAIKFTDRGDVLARLTFSVPTDGDTAQVALMVSDTGIGIAAQDQARLFNTFTQASGPRASQGAGLGLVISRTLAELMGGSLQLQSVESVGTRVEVQLPLALIAPPVPTEQDQATEQYQGGPLNVLVVDDYPANLMLLEKQLNSLGHQVTLAENGETGLALWQAHTFDLVITDCSMPVMDGHEFTRKVRQLEQVSGQPACSILGVTANAQAEERQRCLDSGMDDCLFKPIGLQTLKARLAHLRPGEAGVPAPTSGFNLDELRHLTQGDQQLTKRLLEQLTHSAQQDLAALQALACDGEGEGDGHALRALAHRIKGGAKMLRVRGVVMACEAIEQAHNQGLPTQALGRQLELSLESLLKELCETLSAIAASS